MTGDEWARLEAIFEHARQQPLEARAAWLDAACPDADMRALLTGMLAAYDADPEFLEASTDVGAAVATALAEGLVGTRLGPYRVTGQLGRGGMGVVYDAVRDDGDFQRRVAIKVLPVFSGTTLTERFRLERRVHATLDHPGIARLVDSGATPDGAPYFVMEFVDGRPIDAWCREQQLGVRARVALLERVCEAVAYAHQRLVIHRDIKPANILVTSEGLPKLLDFGIATLLSDPDGAASGATKTGHQSFTIDFASPEQVSGEPVTTASDVYSLGVLLYMLVSGQRPYTLHGLPPLEAMRAVCEVDPSPPSTRASGGEAAMIRGDLDAVVLKALRKAPADRYGTVAAFATELRAWLHGLPVTAAPESLAQRTRRFVRRNKAAAAVLAALVVGGGVATWQARVATLERDKAQRRFIQVQEFSRSLIFDVNEALQRVPGNTEPRRLLLDRAVQFLDGLAADAGGDDALDAELIAGYRRLGDVQGNVQGRNLGDAAGAAVSYEKATAIAERALLRQPTNTERLWTTLSTLDDLGRARGELGELEARGRAYARHLELVQRLEAQAADPRALAWAAEGYSDAGLARTRDDPQASRRYYEHAIALYERLPSNERMAGSRGSAYSFVLKRLGAVLLVSGEVEAAERHYRSALAIDEEVVRGRPGNTEEEYSLTFSLSDLGATLVRLGRLEEAETLWRRALEIRKRAATADPKDVRALSGTATMQMRLEGLARKRKDFAGAVAAGREELVLRDRVLGITGPLPGSSSERAWAALNLSTALLDRADAAPGNPERTAWIAEASRLARALRAEDVKERVVAGSVDGFRRELVNLLTRLPR